MMKRLLTGTVVFLAIVIPLVLFDLNTVAGWHIDSGSIFPLKYYVINEMILLFLGFEALIFAFLAHRAGRRVLDRVLLISGGLLFMMIMLDCAVLFFSCFSTGPGGRMCVAHVNWYKRFIHNNSLGYWERDLSPYLGQEPHKGKLIAIVGDSFTWGQGLPGPSLRFTDRLGKSMGDEAEVLNFGRGGADTRDELKTILPDVEKVHPDVIILCYLANDIHNGIHLVTPIATEYSPWQRRFLQASPVYNYLYFKALFPSQWKDLGAWSFFSIIANYLDPTTMAEHRQDIRALVDRVRAMKARPVAVIIPFPHLWQRIEPDHRKAIYASIAESFRSAGAPVIELENLEQTFPPGKFEINSMDGHPNAKVHQAIAERIHEWLETHPEAWR
jgi:lysophospholipase L1-like esterase